MKRISKYPHYIFSWAPYILIYALILTLFTVNLYTNKSLFLIRYLFLPMISLMIIILITDIVTRLTLIYKMWSSIQYDKPRTTPGKAVINTFIPFYNYYWNFRIYQGFAEEYNSLIRSRQLNLEKLNEKLFLKYCIFKCLEVIPFLNVLFFLIPVPEIIYCKMVSQICEAVNELNEIATSTPQLLLKPILPQRPDAQSNFTLRTKDDSDEGTEYYAECMHCGKILELNKSEIEMKKFTCPCCFAHNDKLITVSPEELETDSSL